MKRREWLSLIVLALVTVSALLIGCGYIYVTGVDGNRLKRPETIRLLMEMAVVFVMFFATIGRVRNFRLCSALLVLEAAVFTWIHQAFLPMVVSGLYLAFILKTGSMFRRFLDRDHWFAEYNGLTAMADFTLGCGLLILLFCLMSLAGIGGIPYTRAAVMLLAALFWLPLLFSKERRQRLKPRHPAVTSWAGKPLSISAVLLFALILTMLCLQIGRMNICVDYDSLHYGLRSEYILNDGGGVYENMGSINVVYTYSKGLEILLFPISGLPSYSFFLSFQVWMTAGILLVCGKITELFVSRRYALLSMALLSCIPGIMNMGITAKTDSATALFQLIMISFILCYIKKQRSCYLVVAVDAYVMTMVLKPTALVFSTAAAGTALLYVLAVKWLRFKRKGSLWFSAVPMACMWGLVWLRTWLHTGLPVTSVFYSVWAKLGFSVRYPYRFENLPSNGGTLFSLSGIKHLLKRLYGVLLAPVGDDMAHVRIAWGTSLLLIYLVLFLLPLLADMRELRPREKKPLVCLVLMFFTNGIVSLAALYLLWQVDGNYFILLYCLFTILAVVVIGKLRHGFLAHAIVKLLAPVALFNISVTAVSNWSGTLGLSPMTLLHKGYYDHRQEARELMTYYGNEEIWQILASDPTTRVLVFGEQPEMLSFPCNAQSYTDIEGSGGNFYVSASPEALVSFFDYAGIDYIYLGSGYLKPGTEGWRNVTALLERGYLTEVFYENGNGLGKFVKEPMMPENPETVLEEFALKYWPGEQQ